MGEDRRKNDLSDVAKVILLALLVAGAFLAGVLTANYQVRQIVDETANIAGQVKDDLKREIERQDIEFNEHRRRDRIHICETGISQLQISLAIYDIAQQAKYDTRSVPTKLRPEVRRICAEVDQENGK